MDAGSSQVEAKPLIEADLGENGGRVSFASIQEAKKWANRELTRWQHFWTQIEAKSAVGNVLEHQIELPTKIKDGLNEAEQAKRSDQPTALQEIENLLERYADYGSLCSTSPLGIRILEHGRHRHELVKIGALASALGVPAEDILDPGQADDHEAAMILSGYAIGNMRNVVKRSDISEVQSRLDVQLAKMTATVERAEKEREETSKTGENMNNELGKQREAQKSAWDDFHSSAEQEWNSLRKAFEEHLRLEAPATYWKSRARWTFWAAMASLSAFAALAVGFIWLVWVYGPVLLETLSKDKAIGDFATLTMVSIPALTALWLLRHIGRLFVTNFERSGDARMRQTMATTFLALTKEGPEAVTQEERLMVLQALFRAPAESKGDEGHFGSALDILTRKDS